MTFALSLGSNGHAHLTHTATKVDTDARAFFQFIDQIIHVIFQGAVSFAQTLELPVERLMMYNNF